MIVVLFVCLTVFSLAAAFLWVSDRDVRRRGELPKADPPSNVKRLGEWRP